MKIVLFCKKPYSFGIMLPLYNEAINQGHNVLWYFPENLKNKFPISNSECNYCCSIPEVYEFNADVNFAPGNDFPHYLPGVKIQIFHGLAGEKSGHFYIRHYFDLYLTQGPYFTQRFKDLSKKYKNFTVIETGWCKLDTLFTNEYAKPKELKDKNLILYAPTFSPSLTSAIKYKDDIIKLSNNKNNHVIIKFHDKMEQSVVDEYKQVADTFKNIEVSDKADIIPLLQQCDIMISDTSSVVYEFLLLDKPVITLNSTSAHIKWDDLNTANNLEACVQKNMNEDPHKMERSWFIQNYHPYIDGKSSARMLEAAEKYINDFGVPQERKLPFLRRRKMIKTFGKKPKI